MAHSSPMYWYFYPYFWNGKNRFFFPCIYKHHINNGDIIWSNSQKKLSVPQPFYFAWKHEGQWFRSYFWGWNQIEDAFWDYPTFKLNMGQRSKAPELNPPKLFKQKKKKQVQKWKEFDDLDFLPFHHWMPQAWYWQCHLKFMFSKNTTKNDEIFTVNLTLCRRRQIDGEDFFNFCCLLRKHEV